MAAANDTLLAFTGGADSSYLAHKILRETNENLRLFWMDLRHLQFDTPDGPKPFYERMLAAEAIVAPRVAKWLSDNVRPVPLEIVTDVKYLPEPPDYPSDISRQWRSIPMLKTASAIMHRDGLKGRFIYGRSAENTRNPHRLTVDAWYQEWWKENAPKGTKFEQPLIDLWHGRPHALTAIPRELMPLVLTCNNPPMVNGEPVSCETCQKCRLTAESRRLLDDGVSPDVILDFLLRKRRAGPHVHSLATPDRTLGALRDAAQFERPIYDKE